MGLCCLVVLGAGLSPAPAEAQDAVRGAALYLQLPGNLASCVSCHGPDPAANRNNLLRAAGQPLVLLKTLNAVGVMGYLKLALSDADIADLSAYLDTVARAASDPSRSVWPRTIEFGDLGLGEVSPEHTVRLRNLSAAPLTGVLPRLAAGRFDLRHDCPGTLAPGTSCSAHVRAFAPTSGQQTADALVWGDGAGAVIGLSARGASGPVARLVLDPAVLDMGSAEVGTVVTRRVRVLNAGTADATLGVATLTGPTAGAFSTDGRCPPATVVSPGTACTLDLRWRAGAAVAYDAVLQWRGDGTHPAPMRLQALGTSAGQATDPPAAPPAAEAPAATGGGGGCTSSSASAQADTGTTWWAAFALGALIVRRRRPACRPL
jgi:MYXO-CTERM domain-containing protein